MFRGSAILVLLLLSLHGFAQEAAVKEEVVTSITKTALGGGYILWNEEIEAQDGSNSSKGNANYAGLTLHFDKSWTLNGWVWGGTVGLGAGKATADGFDNSVSYTDSAQRPWTLYFIDMYSLFSPQPNVMIGLGLLAYQRTAQWTSDVNANLEVNELVKTGVSPELLFRYRLSKTATLLQTISPQDFNKNAIWRWSVQFFF